MSIRQLQKQQQLIALHAIFIYFSTHFPQCIFCFIAKEKETNNATWLNFPLFQFNAWTFDNNLCLFLFNFLKVISSKKSRATLSASRPQFWFVHIFRTLLLHAGNLFANKNAIFYRHVFYRIQFSCSRLLVSHFQIFIEHSMPFALFVDIYGYLLYAKNCGFKCTDVNMAA